MPRKVSVVAAVQPSTSGLPAVFCFAASVKP